MIAAKLLPLPASWSWTTLGAIAEVRLGKMLSPKAYEEGLEMLPYLRNENVRWGYIDLSDLKNMGFKPGEIERYQVRPGDLLVCEGGEPGRCAILKSNEPLMYQKALHRVRPIGGSTDPAFLQYCLRYYITARIVIPRPSETTIQHLPLEKMVGLPIPLAPPDEQRRIVGEIETQFSRLDAGVAALKQVQAKLKRYRAAVLQAACEGQLVPTEAELARAEGRDYEAADRRVARVLVSRRAWWESSGRRSRYAEPSPGNGEVLCRLPVGWTGCSSRMG